MNIEEFIRQLKQYFSNEEVSEEDYLISIKELREFLNNHDYS